ncbi:TraR/DksA C4-type zinc finger protein [Geomonas sp. Red32]|uniref:TraR/DksA family transcriptional regulator n=1 Tax=Geomonas sp. Red32 TaxID=2912856 RepID=UPI00202CF17E|nr:TraR/DksA C4-type zinc finger protein [Geomonas sp. Red32]MCM0081710.1 TraR/DksA C4-type zinc finger protein [Geomonas sp. Red32]
MAGRLEGDELELRNLLAEQKRRLWTSLREEIFDRAGEEIHAQYEIPQDIGEQSILDLLSDAGLAVADIRKNQLTQLEEAQKRLEAGTYGRCESCGEPISVERLRAVPFTPFCVGCQRAQEAPQKGPGTTL